MKNIFIKGNKYLLNNFFYKAWFIILFIFYVTDVSGTVISQAPAGVLPVSEGTKLVALDWDLDGDLDLIVLRKEGTGQPGSVMSFENNNGTYGFSGFWDFMDYTVNYNAIYVGDLNNDGWQDLVLNKKGEMIRSVMNDYGGFNEYASAWTYTNNSQVQDVLLADFNNDGYLDMAVANYSNNNWIFKGNGDGTFSSSPDFTTPGTNLTIAIAAADMNNDGNLDLICANDGAGNSNICFLLDGNFGFSGSFTYPDNAGGYEFPKSLAVGDVDNDGDFDVIVGCVDTTGTNGAIQILTNSGAGNCAEKFFAPIGNSVPVNIDIADINADGILDMAVTIENKGVNVLIGSNSGNYGLDISVGGDIYAIFCDYDNDTDLDVVFAHIHNNTSEIISSTAAGFNSSVGVEKTLKFGERHVLLQTYNKIIIGGAGIWGGSGVWGGDYTNELVGRYISSIAVGDVNGVLSFQDLDDYVIGTKDGWIYVYTNASTNWAPDTFNLCWSNRVDNLAGITGYKAYAMALGDINGDGAPDLVFQTETTQGSYSGSDTNIAAFIALNSGNNGFYTNAIKVPLIQVNGQPLPMDAKVFLIEDIDNDGDNDIIAGTGGPDWIAYNKGQGLFDETTFQYPESGETRCLALGDIDGDGDLDLIRGNAGQTVEYSYGYENINGIFSYNTIWQSPTLYAASAMVFDDVDKDSDVDLCFANNIDVEESFVMENKNGVLGTTKDDYLLASSDPNGPPGMNMEFSGIIVRDLDGDNDDDIFLVTSYAGKTNKIFKGLYQENFQVEARNLPNVPAYAKLEIATDGPPTNNSVFSALPVNIIGYDGDNTNTSFADVLIRIQVSLNDGATWKDASYTPVSGWVTSGDLPSSFFIKASRKGVTNQFEWNASADAVQGTRFLQRVIVYPQYSRTGRIHHSAYIYYDKGSFYVNGQPNAFISSPVSGGDVMGTVKIIGAAYDYDFSKYIVTIKNSSDTVVVQTTNTTPVPPVGTLYSWDTSSLSQGSYTIYLDVFDNLEQVKSADPVSVSIVQANSDAPTVTAVYPVDGAEDVPANSPVIVQFSRYMNVNTMRDDTMTVTYNEQEELSGNAKYKNLVKSLIFDAAPNLVFNASHLSVIDGDFKDVLGNKIGNDYMWNFKAEEGLPVSIDKGYPTGEDVETNTVIKVYYNSDMSSYTNFNDNTFYVQDAAGNKVSGAVSSFNSISNTVTFTPTGGLKGSTIYIVTIKKDIISDSVPYPYSWYFITKDTVKPVVVSTTPAANEDFFDPLQEIKLIFNKTMNVNQLQENIFELKESSGKEIDGSLTYDIENNILIFKPKTELNGVTKYIATLKSKFEDMGGQEIGSDYQWIFRTTRILTSSGGEISSSDNKIKLRMPKNAVTSSIALSISKLSTSELSSLPSDDNLRSVKLAYRFYPEGTKFNKPITITLSYNDNDNNGLVDDPDTGIDFSPSIDEKKLALFYYNESTHKYERIGGTVDTANNTLTAAIKHFSIFGIFEDLSSYNDDLAITEINTYPRIFKPSSDDHIDINFNVALTGSGTADIKLYNLAGRLVKTIISDMSVNSGINYVQWDGKDKDSDLVHNRMYVLLITVEDSTGKKVRKTKTLVVEE